MSEHCRRLEIRTNAQQLRETDVECAKQHTLDFLCNVLPGYGEVDTMEPLYLCFKFARQRVWQSCLCFHVTSTAVRFMLELLCVFRAVA